MANKDSNIADEHYKKTFATSKQLEEMEQQAATQDDEVAKAKEASTASSKGVKEREEQQAKDVWKSSISGNGTSATHIGRSKIGMLRHGSAFAFLVGLVGLGLWYASVFAPNILLVNIKEMFTNDLADATIALYAYDKKMMDHKLGGADCGEKDSIKCKLSTMSRNEVKRFEKAGFTVNGEKVEEDNLDDDDYSNDKPESRYKVTSIEFPHGAGTASSADDYEKIANKSNNLKALAYSVWDPRSSFFQDERFKQRLQWKYNLTKEVTVTGETEEDVIEAFDKSMTGEDETMDSAGGGNYSLNGLAGDVGKDGLKKTAERIANLTNAYGSIQCAYYTQFKVGYAAAKKAKEVSVARFAMQYLKGADQIKAGLAEEVAANFLSGNLAWSDDGSYWGKNATDGSMYRHILFNEKAANESIMLYNLNSFDIPGVMTPAWLVTVFLTQQTIKGMMNLPGNLNIPGSDIGDSARKYCLETQKESVKAAHKPSAAPNNCPILTVGDTPPMFAPLVADIIPQADFICPMPPPMDRGCCWMMYPTASQTVKRISPLVQELISPTITNWASERAKNFTSDTKGRSAAEALFAGTGAILGDMGISRGMRPGNKQSMSEYLAHKPSVEKDLEDVARYNASRKPFDIYNKYSFAGSLVRSLALTSHPQSPVLSSLANIFAIIPSSLQQITPNDTAKAFYYLQPLEFDSSRLSCDDQEYDAIGIEADTLCNIRVSMSDDDLNATVDDVLKYMLESHSDETKDNIEELQKRLNETDQGADTQDKADVQRQLDQAKEGSNAKMIDEKTGEAVRHSEYEKFLTYCVNREMPWGRTGMATQYQELSQDEKAERRKYVTENGKPIEYGYTGDPYELSIADNDKSAYMAVWEGTAADQDWYTGKKCLEESEMLKNFRAYTMMCSVDGSHAGAMDCTEDDRAGYYFDGFYHNNDILYTSYF